MFDKRAKQETPSKAYFGILEETIKADKSASYLLNTNALNTTQVIARVSTYNIDIPTYHNNVDQILRTFRRSQQRITFDVIKHQDAYDNKGVIHVDFKPKQIGLSNVADDSVRLHFAKAMNYVMSNIKGATKDDRGDWKFMMWVHNATTNDFNAPSGPPCKLDGLCVDRFLERITNFIVSGDVQNLNDTHITVKGHYTPFGGAMNDEQRVDLFKKRSLIEITTMVIHAFGMRQLSLCIHQKLKRIAHINDGRGGTRTKLALQMCEHVGFSWGNTVAIEHLSFIEQSINQEGHGQCLYCVLNIEELPQFKHTG
jgi:hypothetical protein